MRSYFLVGDCPDPKLSAKPDVKDKTNSMV